MSPRPRPRLVAALSVAALLCACQVAPLRPGPGRSAFDARGDADQGAPQPEDPSEGVPDAVPPAAPPAPAGPPPAGPLAGGLLPVDLPTVLRLARAQNLDVQIVREGVRAAHARYAQDRVWFLPTLRVPLRFDRTDGRVQATEGEIVDVDKQSAFAGAALVLDWEPGERAFESLASAQRLAAQEAGLGAEREDAALGAAERYLDLLAAQARAAVVGQSVALYEALVAETAAQAEAGGGFRGDVLRARALLARARVTARQVDEEVAVAEARLREHLSLRPGVTLRAVEPHPVPWDLAPVQVDATRLRSEALRARPEVRDADQQAAAAATGVRQAHTGPFIPRLKAGYEAGGFGDGFDDLGGTGRLGVGLEWRVGPGGIGDQARTREAVARQRQAGLRARQVRERIEREVDTALAQVGERGRAIALAREAVAEATEALALYRERQDLGVGLPLDVIDAEATLTAARLAWIRVVVGYNQAQLRLLHAVGRLL